MRVQIAAVMLAAAALGVAGCKSPSGSRPEGPGDPISQDAAATAQTPSGPGSGTGGATPSASNDAMGSVGNTPADARAYEGTPATTAQTPATQPTTSPGMAGEAKATAAPAPSGCTRDDDCVITTTQAEGCCNGCAPRAITRAEQDAQDKRCAEQRQRCPEPMCAPPRWSSKAVCSAGKCEVKRESGE